MQSRARRKSSDRQHPAGELFTGCRLRGVHRYYGHENRKNISLKTHAKTVGFTRDTQRLTPDAKQTIRKGNLRRCSMISMMRNRFLAALVSFTMMLFVTSPGMSAMIPSMGSAQAGSVESQKDIDTIQQALESKLVQEKLAAYGLTADEIASKLSSMTPWQIHTLAVASEDVLAGGDGLGTVVAVLVIVILFIVILKLLNKQVIIKMTSLDASAYPDLPALC
jgi:hypothetical protein